MSTASKMKEFKVPSQALTRGLFVAELDRAWNETPFLFQGFRIENARELNTLRGACKWVVVDPAHSDPEALRAVTQALQALGAGNDAAGALPDPNADDAVNAPAGRGTAVAWLRREAAAVGAPRPARRRLSQCPPFVERRARDRSPLVAGEVALVRYRHEVAFEQEIELAQAAATTASEVLRAVHEEVARGTQPGLAELMACAQELVVSIVRNPDPLQWLLQVRDRDAAAHTHGVRCAVYLLALARHLGFAPSELMHMASIGLLLDLGKARLDPALLQRAGPLTPAELGTVQQHVQLGLQAVAAGGALPEPVIRGIAEHHERADGSGYPRQLPDSSISIYGKMAGLADSFAAMTTARPHAAARSPFEAMKVLNGEAGTRYPAPLVEQFLKAVGMYPTGTPVELSNGQLAIVVCQNRVRQMEPRLLVLTDTRKKPLERPHELDLLKQPSGVVNGKDLRIERGLPHGLPGIDLGALH